MIEFLEKRQLLSTSLVDGVLTVTGTSGDDSIVVYVTSLDLTMYPTDAQKRYIVNVNNEYGTFAFNDIEKVIVRAGAGNDVVDLALYTVIHVAAGYWSGVQASAVVRGEAGNDTIYGGLGPNMLRGNAGDDAIDLKWSSGRSLVEGGEGNDMLNAALREKGVSLWGGAGNDRLTGSSHDDNLRGDDGNDVIDGGEGHDRIHGGNGNDTLRGGGGNDAVFGDDGKDLVSGGIGKDRLIGGHGRDRFVLISDVESEIGDFNAIYDQIIESALLD